MLVPIVIVIIIIAVIVGIIILRPKKKTVRQNYDKNNAFLLNVISRSDVIVEGEKGSGKDLLFSLAAQLLGDLHYSNIRYNSNTEVRPLKDLNLGINTFENFVNGTFHKLEPNFEDGKVFFVSDAGVYFPSQFSRDLDNLFPSTPLFVALSRQLHDMRILYNSQTAERIWNKLREQASVYFHCIETVDKGEYLLVKTIFYSNYEQLVSGVLPEDNNKRFICRYINFKVYIADIEYNTKAFAEICFIRGDKNMYLELVKGEYDENYMELLKNV